ncbi:LuxR family transcriptional regulator [Aquimarina sp. U1-2]|uniref:LuxR family transcriptional regulator n=1 Tax=Aquimarina sp. U1-2 TaxID=2823141 RepID=UPI001AECCEED|nr:LuxR family transcriptional regulator [Aquimarina sp. U1-2]MBP2833741.1 LuxR family transcriptional regulator [Aquimarina sp. U1-2]
MFGTSIHWTTFFYLLVDTFIVLFAAYQSFNLKRKTLKRYLILGILFILYNITGGFLPIDNFVGPFILQYIITYGIAITLCIYLAYYLYKEYDITILKVHFSIRNIILMLAICFVFLFLIPFYATDSMAIARASFTLPVAVLASYFLWAFQQRVKNIPKRNSFTIRRYRLSMLCVVAIALLPILTIIGDYQWLTFTVMNSAFYAITIIEIDRYLYFLENKNKMFEVFSFYKENKEKLLETKLIYQSLTRREIEIAISIININTYKEIGQNFFIAERTVSGMKIELLKLILRSKLFQKHRLVNVNITNGLARIF